MIGELAALGASISWAVAPLLYKKALANTSPVSANIVRCITNASVLVVLLLILDLTNALTSLPLWVILVTVTSGIMGLGVGDTLYMTGLKTIGVSKAVPLAATYPLFGLVWGVILLGQPLYFLTVIGAGIIVLGIWLLSRQSSEQPGTIIGKKLWLGVSFSLITAVIWSVSITLMDIAVSKGASGLGANYAIVTLRITSIALVFTATIPVIDKSHGFRKIGRRGIILLCAGGLVANGLGWLLMNYSFLNIPETQAIPISSTSPLFAALAGYLFFREKATIWSVFGVVAIVVGIVFIFMV
jgi:drug/metabolite transporter (DMT)-like permease